MGGHLFVSSQLVEWFRSYRQFFEFLKGGLFSPLFEILKSFLFLNKKLWVVTFLFEVDWLSGLGVIGIF